MRASDTRDSRAALYRTLWRWHFYAGLFVMPFILILSVTGAAYLFKPQIDRWEERDWRGLPVAGSVTATAQVAAALASVPGASLNHYRLPAAPGDAAVVHVALADGGMRDIAVSPQGSVLATDNPETRIAATLARIHGTLLIGMTGSLLVELAASWAIVMVLTGLYLWWPRGRGLAGAVWPRLRQGKQAFWRDLHAVTGFWISGLVLVLLVSGLPWTDGWATGFRWVRAEMGWVQGAQSWKGGVDLHAAHDHQAMQTVRSEPAPSSVTLDTIVLRAAREAMPAPAIIMPPGAAAMHGPPNGNVWTLTTQTQDRTAVRSVSYDPLVGHEVARSGFADKHILDRIIGTGIAWHEGALFGWVNQLVGVLTALGLVIMTVSGFILWRRRKPDARLGAPPVSATPARMGGVVVIVAVLALLLPMLAASLILLWVFDRLLLPRLPRLARWLGVGLALETSA